MGKTKNTLKIPEQFDKAVTNAEKALDIYHKKPTMTQNNMAAISD